VVNHYLAILVPEESGGWTVLFPDLPGCATHGATVQEAQLMAAEAADRHLAAMRESGAEMPAARTLEAVQSDAAWLQGRGIDWSKVVVSLIKPSHLAERKRNA
jgi:predicted RNase H-like HicB family nuclease